MGKYKELVSEYKQKARRKYEALKKQRRTRRKLPLGEQFELLRQDRQKRLAWKKRIKALKDPREQYAQKKGYKYYRKLQHRKFKWGIFIGIIVILGLLFLNWYLGATKPLTTEQQAAREQSLQVAREVMEESIVLLQNKHATLPLAEQTKLNIFGAGSAAPVYSGGGAGGISSATAESLYEAFDAEGATYNPSLYNLYNNFTQKNKVSTDAYKKPAKGLIDTLLPNIAGFLVKSPTELDPANIPEATLTEAKEYSSTALYVVSRAGTETVDLKPEELRLTDNERATLALLNKHFAHIIVIANTTNVMELGFVNDFEHIDSVLWVGGPGEVGMRSVAAVLKGEVTPSGKLPDTYMYDIAKDPAVLNTGNFQYKDADGNPVRRYFTNYQESIYIGYRYYETFVSEADYASTVQYPFGYGLSYTTFDWKIGTTSANASTVSAQVTVTNTGKRSGKEVVQLYYRPPFVKGGIEKAAIVLGGYAKTKLLAPGESDTVTISFDTTTMASYDDRVNKAWTLDAGTYQLVVARDVHTPVQTFAYTQPTTLVIRRDATTGTTVTNQFDDTRGSLDYLSRSNPSATAPKAPTQQMFTMPSFILSADYTHIKSSAAEPTTGAKNNLKLADLKGLDYDDPKWSEFLDQLTADDLVKFTGHGGYWSVAIDHVGIPRTAMFDGPTSIRNFLDSWATVAYPAPVNLAATWNSELAETIGQTMGKEAQSFNVDATYAPSLNMHRSPLGGRNFEYYSEDPLLAGKTGAAITRGLQSTGTIAVIKHFVANDQETNRANFGLYTWLTEQSLREIYLKPFELAVKEGGAHGAMSAFNRLGTTWAGGDKALLTTVLRNEWGFRGFVITDAGVAGQGDHFDALQALEAGNDLMLGLPLDIGANDFEKQLKDYLKEDRAGTLIAMRSAAHNICYYVLQTNKL